MCSGIRRSSLAALGLFVLACASAALAGPARICSTSLAGDELLALLVEPSRVACVSTLADDPRLSHVVGHFPGTVARVIGRIEPVLGARPDLVLVAPWNDPDFRRLLTDSGVEVEALADVKDFDGIRRQVLELGRRLGVASRAREVVAGLDADLARADEAASRRAWRPGILSFSHGIVAGAETTVDALIRRAGGVNVAAEAGIVGHTRLPMEALVALDPEVLLLGFDTGEDPGNLLAAYPHLAATRAVREGRIVILPPRLLTTVTPFLTEGVLALQARLAALERNGE
ncbi:MAG: ABC transporter substrate-binding protein [Acidobacteriota bacterium]|nr:ABC transporter substrate-binding protein [Acidobacteriota bacterium]